MAGIFARVQRLTFWLAGTPDDSPPPVPIPPEISPLLDHVGFFLNLRGRLPPEMTREEIMDYVNDSVTDRQLQAHAMAYLRDHHGMVFDPNLNPKASCPRYYSSKNRGTTTAATLTTGPAADDYAAADFGAPPDVSPPLLSALYVTAGTAEALPPTAAAAVAEQRSAEKDCEGVATEEIAE